ncbi:hypothetical protein LTR74_002784 [Friedmanniomyces endolithicus]|nr:hypothetical protein LTR74_002784 [Friedmanniomyces endolithicus]
MPLKRKSVDAESDVSGDDFATSAPAPKKRQTHTRLKTHTLESLLAMPHEELAAHALSLQNQASQRTNGNGAEAAWTDEKITERAKKNRDICKAGIETAEMAAVLQSRNDQVELYGPCASRGRLLQAVPVREAQEAVEGEENLTE